MTNTPQNSPKESFESLLAESFGSSETLVGQVLKGRIIAIESDIALIDVGLKSEGRVPLREFSTPTETAELKVGDEVDVYLERMENKKGEAVLSHEKARREAVWVELEKSFKAEENVNGVIFGKVKGGFTVDLNGAVAFLPGSQVDIRPIRDMKSLMNLEQPFQILKMDRARGNIVVSRRAIMEESRAEARSELISNIVEGQVIEGVVKNVADYGAFIDLGGADGLLHVTDISWGRVNHPSEVLQVGQSAKVMVIRFNKETQRISLGMKQLEDDPWVGVERRYEVETLQKGQVTNVTDYGAFVELEKGVEGLVHVSEMSWTKKNQHPSKIVSPGQEVEIKILDIDPEKRRIGLGMKQCTTNPWDQIQTQFPIGTEFEGEIKNITEFGLFVGVVDDIDGMVHMSDLSWDKTGEEAIKDYTRGDKIKVKILDINADNERVVLGVKQMASDPFEDSLSGVKKGQVVTCEVKAVQDAGIDVILADGAEGFVRKAELAKDRAERRPDRFAVGEKVDAKVSSIDRASRRIILSIKACEVEEEKRVMEEYGSTDSGASLGDILGAAIRKKGLDVKTAGKSAATEPEPKAEKKEPAKKAATKKATAKADTKEEAPKEV